VIITYKYRLKGRRTARKLRRYAWAVNQVWNYCVQMQREIQRRWKDGLRVSWPSSYDLCKLTAGTSKELSVHGQTIQSVCTQFAKSRDQHRHCPRLRCSTGARRALGWVPFQPQSRRISGNSIIYLGNTFRFFGAKRRPLPNVVKGGAFVEDASGKWYVTLHVEVAVDQHSGVDPVGIDLGLTNLATLSTGEKIAAPRTYRRYEERLAIARRSGNRRRARAINAKIARVRADQLHKLSARVVACHGAIFVGDVSSSKLASTRLAKSVYDAGWSTFRGMLRYKASRHGAVFLEVDENFTSQRCSSCGDLPSGRPRGIASLGIREWECSSCGANHDRDVNAAKNILAIGLSHQPPTEGSFSKGNR